MDMHVCFESFLLMLTLRIVNRNFFFFCRCSLDIACEGHSFRICYWRVVLKDVCLDAGKDFLCKSGKSLCYCVLTPLCVCSRRRCLQYLGLHTQRVNKTVSQVIIVKESKLYADWIKVEKLLLCLGSILFTTIDNRHTRVVLVTFYHSPFLHV